MALIKSLLLVIAIISIIILIVIANLTAIVIIAISIFMALTFLMRLIFSNMNISGLVTDNIIIVLLPSCPRASGGRIGARSTPPLRARGGRSSERPVCQDLGQTCWSSGSGVVGFLLLNSCHELVYVKAL